MKTQYVIVVLLGAILFFPTGAGAVSDWLGGTATILFANSTPTAAPTAAPTPSPSPASGCGPYGAVDPNANSAACSELAYLYNLENAGGTNHLIVGAQVQLDGGCNNAGACGSTAWNNQTANEGGVPMGEIGIDPCSPVGAGAGNPLCAGLGTNGAAAVMADYVWSVGGLVMAHTDFPNPIVAYNNPAAQSGGTACPGGGAGNTWWGASYDCTNTSGESWNTYVSNMSVPGKYENANWNTELNLYTSMWQQMQNNGVVVLVDMFQEADSTAFWWGVGPGNITLGALSNLTAYTEHYWESQGIHNLLYGVPELAGAGANSWWPGCGVLDWSGWDEYGTFPGSPYVFPQYTGVAGFASGCGKSGMPQMLPEQGSAGSTNGGIPATLNGADPNLVLLNNWSVDLAGNNPPYCTGACATGWNYLVSSPYTEQLSGVAAGR